VKTLDNLYLSGINQMALRVSEDARVIDEVLRAKAATDAKRFAPLRAQAAKRAATPAPMASKGGWADKIAKMRETHPNAYRPWEPSQDDELRQGFQNGLSVKELSKALGRHEGSITMRLQKLFGEDVVQ
jgi:hypothetical protein